jgi:TP901 family phage tail tape measure protein
VSVVANVAINVDSRNAVSKLRQVESQAKITERAFNGLSSALAAFGAGFAISRVIQDVKELDTNLRRLGTVGGDVAALDKGLGQLSKNLDGVANKAELAAASYQALSAGFTETGANLRVVEAATKAAVGGMVDVTSVVEVTTKTLNAYGLSGQYAINVTDSISKAIEYGQVQWSDYTSQLGRVASIAALAGVSLDEVNAFIAAATKNGATAEVAFTGLGATLATILKPSKESADAAKALGINWTLAGIRGEGFESLMGKLAKAMQENPVLATEMVGGQEAIRGAFAAAAKGGQDYRMILEGLGGAAGKTQADFETMKESLENTLKGLDTSFKNLSEAFGRAFGPTVAIAIQDITNSINGFADVINTVPQPVLNATGELIKFIAQMLLVQKVIKGIIGLHVAFNAAMIGMAGSTAAAGTAAKTSAGAFALYTNNTRALQAQAAATTPVLNGMLGTLRSLAAIGTIAILVNVAVTGMAAVYQAQAEIDRLRGVRAKGGPAASYGGSATAEQKAAKTKILGQIAAERESPEFKAQQLAAQFGVGKIFGRQRADILSEREANARAVLALPTRAEQAAGLPTPTPTPVPTGAGDSGGGKAKKDKAAEEEARMQARLRGLVIETNAIQKQQQIREKITQAEIAGDQQLATRLQGEERTQQILASVQGDLVGITDERERQAVLAKAAAEIDAVQSQTAGELNKLEADRSKAIEDVVGSLDMELLRIQANTDAQKQALQFLEIENQLKAQGITLTDGDAEAIRRKIAEIQKLTKEQEAINAKLQMEKDLFDGMANTVAGAFSSAFDAAVSGTENLGEALKGLGADLLATIGKMLIMYAIAQGLGALGGTDGKGVFSFLAKGFGFKGAKDGAYWPGGFEAFADGGVVTSPTMGLIGEGGEPEYVIPASKMRGAMSRYAGGARGNNVIPGSGAEGGTEQGGVATMEPIDVRYSVERINSVDYVTADQFQRGMQQAAAQGAKQGEQRALSTLKQNTNVRRSVGI